MPSEQENEWRTRESLERSDIAEGSGNEDGTQTIDSPGVDVKKKVGDAPEEEDGGRGGSVEEEMEDELGGGIRIRSQDDGGIFEQDDEEDEDDEALFDFPMPEVELRCPRKRKQECGMRDIESELAEIIMVQDEDEQDFAFHQDPGLHFNAELYPTRKRDRLPLYLLNPDDFPHDPTKQMQIRRAIITYRHHQEKKEQIIRLTEENVLLRDHVESLKSKVRELSRCGCSKNETADLEVLDVVIPVVPPRMYLRGNKAVLGAPYNRPPSGPPPPLSRLGFPKPACGEIKREVEPSTTTSVYRMPTASNILRSSTPKVISSTPLPPGFKGNSPPTASVSNPTVVEEMPKPLINITSSRLANLHSKTLSSTNVVTHSLPRPAISKVLTNGGLVTRGVTPTTRPIVPRSGMALGQTSTVSISGMTSSAQGFIPLASVKSEPGLGQVRMSASATTPIPLSSVVKNEASTPATATPISRIVFAKKGSNSNSVQTASQLLFGAKPNQVQGSLPPGVRLPGSQGGVSQPRKLSADVLSNLPHKNQNGLLRMTSPRLANPTTPTQSFRTPSGQVLKLVSPPVSQNPSISFDSPPHSKYQRILPRPTQGTSTQKGSEAVNNRQQLGELFSQLEDVGDDDLAIFEAIGAQPLRNRKQSMGGSTRSNPMTMALNKKVTRNVVTEVCGEKLELNKYEDIVFEVADD